MFTRTHGDRNRAGGDRALGDRSIGVDRSGDPVSCVCAPGGGGGGGGGTRKIATVTMTGESHYVSGAARTLNWGPFTWTRIPDASTITQIQDFKPTLAYPVQPPFVGSYDSGENFQGTGFTVLTQRFRLWVQDTFAVGNPWEYCQLWLGADENAAYCEGAMSRTSSIGGQGFGPPLNLNSGNFNQTIVSFGIVSFTLSVQLTWANYP